MTRILKIYKNYLKNIVIVINCCWQLKKNLVIVIVNKYFLSYTKIILVIVIV